MTRFRKHLISLLLILSLLSWIACEDDNNDPSQDYRLKEWITSHASAVTTRLVYDYQDDRIIMHRNYYPDSSQYGRVDYLYEKNAIEQNVYHNFDNEWDHVSKYVYEYDDNRMVRINVYAAQDEAWLLKFKTEYTYSNGLLSRESWLSFENEFWKEVSYTLYYYEDHLPVKSEFFARLEDGAMRKLNRREADYYGSKMNSVYSYDYQVDTVNANFKYEFHYDGDKLVRVENFSYEQGWIPAGSKEFTYDSAGNLVSVKRINSEGNQADLDQYSYEPGKGNYVQFILPGGGLISESNYPHPTKILDNQFWFSSGLLETRN